VYKDGDGNLHKFSGEWVFFTISAHEEKNLLLILKNTQENLSSSTLLIVGNQLKFLKSSYFSTNITLVSHKHG
jgi:hypothetical protein